MSVTPLARAGRPLRVCVTALLTAALLALASPAWAETGRPPSANQSTVTSPGTTVPGRAQPGTRTGTRSAPAAAMPSGEGIEMSRLLALVLGVLVVTVLLPVKVAKMVVARRQGHPKAGVILLFMPRRGRDRDT